MRLSFLASHSPHTGWYHSFDFCSYRERCVVSIQINFDRRPRVEILRAAKILHQMEVAHSSQKGAFGLELEGGGKEMIDAPMLKQVSSFGFCSVKRLIHWPGWEYYTGSQGSWLGGSWCKLIVKECIMFRCSEWHFIDCLSFSIGQWAPCVLQWSLETVIAQISKLSHLNSSPSSSSSVYCIFRESVCISINFHDGTDDSWARDSIVTGREHRFPLFHLWITMQGLCSASTQLRSRGCLGRRPGPTFLSSLTFFTEV